ncbi:hypothetical protein SteCoe_420 [Stentor coeruleus]|uniref:Uncharacterized protein n=1 Tax=Stentor coeruleus TaxID=5963 RepID=A0A1R2D448_9CILI|nr:hypothetical protein SteCoe_420 [Stentor coeruleus]
MKKDSKGMTLPRNSYESSSLKSILNEITRSDSQIWSYSYGHSSSIFTIAITNDGTLAFAGCEDSSILVINLCSYSFEEVLNGHQTGIIGLKLSSDDRILVSISYDGIIKTWNLKTRKEQDFIDISPFVPETFVLGESGNSIYIGSNDKKIVIWNREIPGDVYYLEGHTDAVNSLALFNDLTYLVSASKDYSVRLWDINENVLSGILLGHTSWVTCLVLANKRELIISGSEDKTIRIWNKTQQKEECCFKGHTGEIYCLVINNNETILASGAQDKFVKIWCLKTFTLLYSYNDNLSYISALGFLNNDKYLLNSSYRQIIVHNISNYKTELILEGHTNSISSIKVIPGTNKIASSSLDNTFKVWDLDDSDIKATLNGHTSFISCLVVSKDNKLIVSGAWDNTIIVWSIKNKCQKFVLKGHEHYVSSLIICNDSKHVVSGSWDKTVRVWELIEGKEIACFKGHTSNVFLVVQDQKSKHVFSIGGEYSVRCWSLKKLKEKFVIKHNHIISKVVVTKDNKYVVTSCLDGSILFTDLKTHKNEKMLKYDSGVSNFVLSDDYEIMCFALQNGTLNVLNVYKNEIIGSVKSSVNFFKKFYLTSNKKFVITFNSERKISVVHVRRLTEYCCFDCGSQIKDLVLASKNKILITGDENATIKVWNIAEKCLEICFYGHTADVEILCLTKNNKYLVSGSRDFTVKMWRFKKIFEIIKSNKKIKTRRSTLNSLQSLGTKISLSTPSSLQDYDYIHNMYPSLSYHGFCQRLIKKLPPEPNDCRFLFPNCINLNHIYCYLGQHIQLAKSLTMDCPIRRNSLGHSPLYYALARDSQKCVHTLLNFMIELSKDHLKYDTYIQYNFALSDDFFNIIKLPSQVITDYIESIFIVVKDKELPNSLKCLIPPVLLTSNHTKIYFYDFHNGCGPLKDHEQQEIFVEFRTTPMKLDLTHGSLECFKLLCSLAKSPNQKIYSTKLISTIIDYKYREFRLVILFMAMILWINIILMLLCVTIYPESIPMNIGYLIINILLLAHEIIEFIYEGMYVYIRCLRNHLDFFSLIVSFLWIGNNFCYIFDSMPALWLMIVLNFIKGLNGFRAFDNTRFYIRLIARTIKDAYSFLFIFCYTTLAFGALYSVSSDSNTSSFSQLWQIAYELNLGAFNNKEGFSLQYIYFMLASSINVIMMLNLLISILGDSFDKFQIEAKEIDYLEKLKLIIELEGFYLILRKKKNKGYVQLCDIDSHEEGEEKWSGKIKEIENKIDKLSKNILKRFNKIDTRQDKVSKAFESIEKSISRMRKESNQRIDDLALKIELRNK